MNDFLDEGSLFLNKLKNYFLSPGFWLSLLFLIAALAFWRLFRRALRRQAEKSGKSMESTERIVKYILLVLLAMMILQLNGINVSSLVAGFGVATAVVGFGLQDLLKDIIMGFHIASDKFFRPGDLVRYHEVEGIVESFSIRTTKIRTVEDQTLICVCNRNIEEICVDSGRFLLDVPLSYDDDFRKIHATLRRCAERIRGEAAVTDCQFLGTQAFRDSAIEYRLVVCAEPARKYEVSRRCHRILQEELEKDGLTIPFNQLDIHSY